MSSVEDVRSVSLPECSEMSVLVSVSKVAQCRWSVASTFGVCPVFVSVSQLVIQCPL
jgi:hypothetical protein